MIFFCFCPPAYTTFLTRLVVTAMSLNFDLSRTRPATGLCLIGLLICFSACQRPIAQFQRSNRVVLYGPASSVGPTQPAPAPPENAPGNVPDAPERTQPPAAYAHLSVESAQNSTGKPNGSARTVAERIGQHQQNARRLLTPAPGLDNQIPVSEHQPGPKPKKSLREILGLRPRKKLNWWQRISWQLKASIIVVLVAVVFAILNITVLAIVFGVVGAVLLIRGLKKSFKVKRPWF